MYIYVHTTYMRKYKKIKEKNLLKKFTLQDEKDVEEEKLLTKEWKILQHYMLCGNWNWKCILEESKTTRRKSTNDN